MSEFLSWRSYLSFAYKVIQCCRYIHDEEVLNFLTTLWETHEKRTKEIKKGSLLWRAQLGCDYRPVHEEGEYIFDEEIPYPESRMCPLPDRASEGRANSKGIPHLYLSTEKNTAIAETRPWLESKVSLAIFKISRDLKVVDCSNRATLKPPYYLGEPSSEENEDIVWTYIDNAFSRPVLPSDQSADYIPTQIIAELFKSKGLDGLVYKSNLGAGLNIVLFDLSSAVFERCSVYNTADIKFHFEEASPTIIRKKVSLSKHSSEPS